MFTRVKIVFTVLNMFMQLLSMRHSGIFYALEIESAATSSAKVAGKNTMS